VTIGNTFVWCPRGTVKDHLWILISDPAKHGGVCVVINLTESTHGKFSHTLTVGQHRWIYKDSDVNYGDAFATSDSHLQAQVKLGFAKPHDDMAAAIIAEIVKRTKTHPAFQRILRRYLD
jgi:hypothetical protein